MILAQEIPRKMLTRSSFGHLKIGNVPGTKDSTVKILRRCRFFFSAFFSSRGTPLQMAFQVWTQLHDIMICICQQSIDGDYLACRQVIFS